jgi:hypothetical protein
MESKRRTSVASESSLKYEYASAAAMENAMVEVPVLYSPREEEAEFEKTTKAEASVPEPGLAEVHSNRNSILDDMERFQKEIEELREKYRHAA